MTRYHITLGDPKRLRDLEVELWAWYILVVLLLAGSWLLSLLLGYLVGLVT